MRCPNCRFSLVCLAGRLSGSENLTSLCPTCGKLLVCLAGDTDIYLFRCEKRPLTKESKRLWQRIIGRAKESEKPVPAAFHVPDPGPGMAQTAGLLLMRECIRCTGLLRMIPGGRIVDLDELALLAEENRDHVFKLR